MLDEKSPDRPAETEIVVSPRLFAALYPAGAQPGATATPWGSALGASAACAVLFFRLASPLSGRPIRALHLLASGERFLPLGPAYPALAYDEDPAGCGGLAAETSGLRQLLGEGVNGPVHEIVVWLGGEDDEPETVLAPAGPVAADDPDFMRDEVVGTRPGWTNLDLLLRVVAHELAHIPVGLEHGEDAVWLGEFRRIWLGAEQARAEVHRMLEREIGARRAA